MKYLLILGMMSAATVFEPVVPGVPVPGGYTLGGLYRAVEINLSVPDRTKENGIRLLYIGALLGGLAVACHVMVAMQPGMAGIFHRIAEYAFSASVGATVAGAWLAALGTLWNWLLGGAIVAGLIVLMYVARKRGLTIPQNKGRSDGKQ
jgi:hypothetical protein